MNKQIDRILTILDKLQAKKGELEEALLQYRIDNNEPVDVVIIEIKQTAEETTTVDKRLKVDIEGLTDLFLQEWDSIESDCGVMYFYKHISDL